MTDFEGPWTARVEARGDKPALLVNDIPTLPFFYALTDCPGGRWTWEEIPRRNIMNFAAQGVRLFSVSIWLQDLWRMDGSLDIGLARRQIAGILDVVPDAGVIIRLHVNAPLWWVDAHPDERTEYADGPTVEPRPWWGLRRNIEGDLGRHYTHSLASREWLKDTSEKLAELCVNLSAAPEGKRLLGLQVCDGVSHEWHYWGFLDHEPDTGPAMTARFRDWLRERYRDENSLRAAWRDETATFENAQVPPMSAREQTTDALFRDPQTERPFIDYVECQHTAVADAIIELCHAIKTHWPRPILTGVFYGYFFMMFGRQAAGGHLAVDRILRASDIDYLCAPQSYFGAAHNMGGSGQSRGLLAACRLHGKLWLDEVDQAPSTVEYWQKEGQQANMGYGMAQMWGPLGGEDAALRERISDDIAMIRRNTAFSLTRGAGLWFYDFGPNRQSGWWDRPEFLEQIGAIRSLFAGTESESLQSPADVLVVWDSQVYLQFSGRFWNPFTNFALDEMSADLYHAGVIFEDVYLADLPDIDLSRYSAVIFANTWRMSSAQRKFVRDHVARDGRHLIFNYLPGYSDGEINSLDHVSAVTGFKVTPTDSGLAPRVTLAGNNHQQGEFAFSEEVRPFAAVTQPSDDASFTAIGHLNGTDEIAAARRQEKEATFWLFALPWRGPDLMRAVLAETRAHIYNDQRDVIHGGHGLLCIHSLTGGRRRILLRSGNEVDVDLAPRSTVFLDAASGVLLL